MGWDVLDGGVRQGEPANPGRGFGGEGMLATLAQISECRAVFLGPLHILNVLQEFGDKVWASSISLMNSVDKCPPMFWRRVRLQRKEQDSYSLLESFGCWAWTKEESCRSEAAKGEANDCEVESGVRGWSASDAQQSQDRMSDRSFEPMHIKNKVSILPAEL